ncbi:hypothetical protein PRUPE_2G029100 [Prunus persica]|uniref:Uncharacterized protein n=1 Tax=Prunus persica TaxID=3760 RepID=A0A251QA77_PRUPE|nr:hypothetical protein PRUPE_2G029100 [Prunus persica]
MLGSVTEPRGTNQPLNRWWSKFYNRFADCRSKSTTVCAVASKREREREREREQICASAASNEEEMVCDGCEERTRRMASN